MPTSHFTGVAAVLGAFLLAAVLVLVARRLVRRILGALDFVGNENQAAVQRRARQLIRALTILAYGIAALASISLALSRFGVSEARWDPVLILRWSVTHGVNLIIIIATAVIVIRTAHLAIEHLQFKLGRRHSTTDLEWQRRTATLGGILMNLVTVSVGFVAVLMVLRELTIDIVPILTGAGIVGLAIGFGAQNLVRDVISGFFLILEDQVRIGDLARINGVAGTVEQINLRTIMLRDFEGAVQVFPNGTVTNLANLSKQFAYAIVDVRVAYSETLDRVMGTLHEVGASMEHDPVWGSIVLAPLEVLGLESLEGGTGSIRVKFKTQPFNQGKVANELRRRLLTMFVRRRIKPYG